MKFILMCEAAQTCIVLEKLSAHTVGLFFGHMGGSTLICGCLHPYVVSRAELVKPVLTLTPPDVN